MGGSHAVVESKFAVPTDLQTVVLLSALRDITGQLLQKAAKSVEETKRNGQDSHRSQEPDAPGQSDKGQSDQGQDWKADWQSDQGQSDKGQDWKADSWWWDAASGNWKDDSYAESSSSSWNEPYVEARSSSWNDWRWKESTNSWQNSKQKRELQDKWDQWKSWKPTFADIEAWRDIVSEVARAPPPEYVVPYESAWERLAEPKSDGASHWTADGRRIEGAQPAMYELQVRDTEADMLPLGWARYTDPQSSKPFFRCEAENLSKWQRPEDRGPEGSSKDWRWRLSGELDWGPIQPMVYFKIRTNIEWPLRPSVGDGLILPEGWNFTWDENAQRFYFWTEHTGTEATWTFPEMPVVRHPPVAG